MVIEVEIFEMRLNAPQRNEAVLRQIEIPYHILFILPCKGMDWAHQVSRCCHSIWMPESALQFRVDVLSMAAVYESLVRQRATLESRMRRERSLTGEWR